ncbi:MAG: hypothetical protein JXK16_06485, partial [Thiotrichales bacterium]|nr:hypothetical protein [Thiotrichales bacterium]
MFSLFIFFGMLVILLSLKTELFSISFIQRTDGNKRFILFFSGLLLFFSGLYLYFSEPDNYAECLKNELKGVNS